MKRLSSMPNSGADIIADTSVIINLTATARGRDILSALPFRMVVTDTVEGELQEDLRTGRQDRILFNEMVQAGYVSIVALDESAMSIFEQLVIGQAVATLDDGEASTIAFAVARGFVPVIDERKALSI